MKKILLSCMFMFTLAGAAFAQGSGNPQSTPDKPQDAIKFKEMVYNFKEVEYSSDVSHSFMFTNNSNSPITIKEVTPSCGCTTTDYTKGPIMPGKTGSVSIKYDSSRVGYFAKTVSVKINDDSFTLTFLGTVKPAKTDDNTKSQGQ